MSKSIASKGIEMSQHYLKNNDVEIVERNFKSDAGKVEFITKEDDALIFIKVKTRKDGNVPTSGATKKLRDNMEAVAIDYLAAHPQPSGKVRFDIIAVRMTGDNQCLLRHHRDALSGC